MADSTERVRLQRLPGPAWDVLPMPAVIVDQKGIIRHCSDKMSRLLGYEPNRLVGRYVEHLMSKQVGREAESPDKEDGSRGTGDLA